MHPVILDYIFCLSPSSLQNCGCACYCMHRITEVISLFLQCMPSYITVLLKRNVSLHILLLLVLSLLWSQGL